METAAVPKTKELSLREFTTEDIDSFFQLESNPEVVRFQTWGPRSKAESQKLVEQITTNRSTKPRQHIEMAVQTDDKFIGRVGCWIDDNIASLWFSFLPESQGQGYATHATQNLLDILLQQRTELLPFNVLQIECDPRNTGSWKIAEKLGFRKVKEEQNVYECKGEWVDSVVYERMM